MGGLGHIECVLRLTGTDRWNRVTQCVFDPTVLGFPGSCVVRETFVRWSPDTHCDTCEAQPVAIFLLTRGNETFSSWRGR